MLKQLFVALQRMGGSMLAAFWRSAAALSHYVMIADHEKAAAWVAKAVAEADEAGTSAQGVVGVGGRVRGHDWLGKVASNRIADRRAKHLGLRAALLPLSEGSLLP